MTILHGILPPGCGCDAPARVSGLVSIDEALDRIAANVSAVKETERVEIARASGRVLARAVTCSAPVPAFDNSAMDGYAVRSCDLEGDGPWTLNVSGRIPAGSTPDMALESGQAARIFTGAAVPEGADAVVMQEQVRRMGDTARFSGKPQPGENIRRAGSDMAAGATVLAPGQRLGPRQIAACAAAGAATVEVRRRVRIALLVTGDEILRTGTGRSGAMIWDVNSPMLRAALSSPYLEVVSSATGADSREGLRDQLTDLSGNADLIITTGGISVGEEDHVKPALETLGATVFFSGVAVKPGKPVSAGKVGHAHWLGLPGNPLSALVTWQIFGTALLERLTGADRLAPGRRHVVTAGAISRKPGRCEMRPARCVGFDSDGRQVVSFEDATYSGRVGQFSLADGLLILPADTDQLPPGALVEFQPFADC